MSLVKKCSLVVALVIGLAGLAQAQPVDLLVNGSFETGDLTGWTVAGPNEGGCGSNWFVGADGNTGCMGVDPPVEGAFSALTSFDGCGPLTYQLQQAVTLPADPGTSALVYVRWIETASMGYGGDIREFSVRVLDQASQELAVAWTMEVPGSALYSWTEHVADLTTVAQMHWGETLILSLEAYVPECYSGPGGFGLDGVSLFFWPDPPDADGDGIGDMFDNCPSVVNPGQEDQNGDGVGDACSPEVIIDSLVDSGDWWLDAGVSLLSRVDLLLSGEIQVREPIPQPGSVRFVWRAINCGVDSQLEFFLNGVSLGWTQAAPTPDCQCNPPTPLGSYLVNAPSLLAAWRPGEDNFFAATMPAGAYVAWIAVDIDNDGSYDLTLFDEPNGATEPSVGLMDICEANFTSTSIDTQQTAQGYTIAAAWAYANSELPCSVTLPPLADGQEHGLFISGNDGTVPLPAFDLEAFVYTGQTTIFFNDPDHDGLCLPGEDPCPFDPDNDADGDGICGDVDICPYDPDNDADGDTVCGDLDNCPNNVNPGQEDQNGDGYGDACSPVVDIVSLTADASGFDGVVTLTSLQGLPLSGEVALYHTLPDSLSEIRFAWNATGCSGDAGQMEFFLNGTSLGVTEAANNQECSCAPSVPFSELVVTDPALLAAWDPAIQNVLSFSMTGSNVVLGWAGAELDGGAAMAALFYGDHFGEQNWCMLPGAISPFSAEGEAEPEPVMAVIPRPVPTAMRFVWQSTGCWSPTDTAEFFLNGVSLGVAPAANNQECSCLPSTPFSEHLVTDPALLAAWNPAGVNEIRALFTIPGTPFSWAYLELDGSGLVDYVLYDVPGGWIEPSIGEPDICNSNNIAGTVDVTVSNEKAVVIPYTDSTLPCSIPIDYLVDGEEYLLEVTGNDGSVPAPAFDREEFTYGGQAVLAFDDSDHDGVCPVDNCPDVANPDQVDADGDDLGDACDDCPQDPLNDDDGDGVCHGDDNCPTVANPGQEDTDADGQGDACDACPYDPDNDIDGDTICGDVDNCPGTANTAQTDADGDGAGDACDVCPNDPDDDIDADTVCGDVDNCPAVVNPDQANADGDALGDVCDTCPLDPTNDADGDTICGDADNCPAVANTSQTDTDADGLGDACDACPNDAQNDADGDGVCGDVDNCPALANASQLDADGDGAGNACDPCPFDPADDADADGLCGDVDNCPNDANADQADADSDGLGDACDPCPGDTLNDPDGDTVCGAVDNCPDVANTAQTDSDSDGAGDACDACPLDPDDDVDGDGTCGDTDNCPAVANADQADADGDGAGDLCDVCPQDPDDDSDADTVCGDVDNCPDVANTSQADADSDGAGDACDVCPNDAADDVDGDGVCGDIDNCPSVANADQADADSDGIGDVCDANCPDGDDDSDGVCNGDDNCPTTANPDQADADDDGIGDVCDSDCPDGDDDSDGVCDGDDNCPHVANADQLDSDGDGIGDMCDANCADGDDDTDGVCNGADNCPDAANPDQLDTDGDGLGDACDEEVSDSGCGCGTNGAGDPALLLLPLGLALLIRRRR